MLNIIISILDSQNNTNLHVKLIYLNMCSILNLVDPLLSPKILMLLLLLLLLLLFNPLV